MTSNMYNDVLNKQDTINNETIKDYNICIELISLMNNPENIEYTKKCYEEICRIKYIFPPQKNENKFIYGKLGEIAVINMIKKLGKKIEDLDENHDIGSEYKNDCIIDDICFSLKLKLNKNSNVVMINYRTTADHNLDINTIVICINEKCIYFLPKSLNISEYIKKDAGSISYKGSLFTYIKKYKNELIFSFPELDSNKLDEISNLKPVNIMKKLYEEYIK